ncbi:G2/mitotic-specific cyclin-B-like [Dendronephthya gigantea]|uniref:G2/mitotic-specific cyclin-B-like n=1 Tax=Dendronephthya gigantea TaxID=151771 RepID=UPI00106AFA50|nr:G2/mitotic-specific cyclin-B-like [Dendronephthya gigantea]
MAQRRFGNVLSTISEGNNRENNIGMRGKGAAQRATRATLGDIGNNVGTSIHDGKVVTRTQKELNIHTRRPLHKSKSTTSLLPKAELKNVEKKESVPLRITEPMDMDGVVEQVSKAMKHCEITDIDADDHENPQLCAEYANEIYRYLLEYERNFIIHDYMNDQKEINARMRSILVDWLVQVHEKFRLLQETLYLTVSFVDRYLARETVLRSELQLIGVTAMLLASKYEEMYAPEIGDFVYITDQAYDKCTIRKTESKMFEALDYQLGDPLCLHFLRRNSKAAVSRSETHTMAKFFMELMLVDYDSVKFLPSLKAASALYLSLKLLDKQDWDSTLEHYSSYTERALKPCVRRLAQLVMKAKNKDSKLTAVANKYAKHKFLKVSLSPALASDQIDHFADSQW